MPRPSSKACSGHRLSFLLIPGILNSCLVLATSCVSNNTTPPVSEKLNPQSAVKCHLWKIIIRIYNCVLKMYPFKGDKILKVVPSQQPLIWGRSRKTEANKPLFPPYGISVVDYKNRTGRSRKHMAVSYPGVMPLLISPF